MVSNLAPKKQREGDLLSHPPVKAVVKHNWFPGIFQVITLLVFLSVIFFGFFGAANQGSFVNLGAFLVWVIWWPALVLITFFASRSWCTVCPLRLVADKTESMGFNVPVPKWIKKHRVTIALGIFLLHSGIVSYGVDDVGFLTAVYLLVLLALPIIISLIFEKKSFCQAFCPVSGFIGSYAKLSPTELRSADPATCKECRTSDCLKHCPSDLYMGTLDSNETCLLCMECVKHCPNDNIRFSWRSPMQDLWQSRPRKGLNGLIIVMLLGFMIEEVGEEWEVVENAVTAVPRFLVGLGVPGDIYGYLWLDALWMNLAVPVGIVLATTLIARLMAGKGKLLNYATTYVWAFTPLIFSLHLGKMWHRLNANLGFSGHALQNMMTDMTPEQVAAIEPSPIFMGQTLEGIFIFGLVSIGLMASLYTIFKLSQTFKDAMMGRRSAIAFYFTTTMLGVVFLSTIGHWFALWS